MPLPILPRFTFKMKIPSRRCNIDNLSNDALLDIFLVACLDLDAPVDMAMVISNVSTRWHAVAQAPRLWTYITITESRETTVDHFQQTHHRVASYLTRSRSLELEMMITLRAGGQDTFLSNMFRDHTRGLSNVLAPHLSRLRRFTVIADRLQTIHDLQSSFFHVKMPVLETWETVIEGRMASEWPEADLLLTPFRRGSGSTQDDTDFYPRLVSAKLGGTPVTFRHFAPRHLKALNLSSLPTQCWPTLQTLRDILLVNEGSLESLEMDFVPRQGEGDSKIHSIILPNLTSLAVGFMDSPFLLPLIQTLPRLDILSITDQKWSKSYPIVRDQTPHSFFAILTAMVECFPLSRLRELSLSHIYIFPDLDDMHHQFVDNALDFDICIQPFQFFASMHELEVLTLVYPTPMVLDIFNYIPVNDTSPKQPLPALKHLNLPLFNLPVVWDFLEARRLNYRFFSKLESISLDIPAAWQQFPELDMRSLCRSNPVEYFDPEKDIQYALHTPPLSYWLRKYLPRCDFTDLYLRDRDYMATTYNHWI